MTELRPNYYQASVKDSNGTVVQVECFDLIDGLGLDFYTGNALKYLWRAGRKTPSKREDLVKALTYVKQAIERTCGD